jgi:hypothetical protein
LIHCVAEALLTASYVKTGLEGLGLREKRTGVAGRNGPQRWVPEDGSSIAGWSREETSSLKNYALRGIMGGIMSL